MLIFNIFSFSQNVFKTLFPAGHFKLAIFWFRVNPFPNKFICLHVCRKSLLKTLLKKEKLLFMSNFSFSHSVFYSFEEFFTIFIEFNSLPHDKFLDWSKLKAFADNKINVNHKQKFFFG